MTDEQPTVADAVTGVLHDSIDGMVTGFVMVAEYIDRDGQDVLLWEFPDGQKQSTTLGLLAWARGLAEHDQRRYLDGLGGDG